MHHLLLLTLAQTSPVDPLSQARNKHIEANAPLQASTPTAPAPISTHKNANRLHAFLPPRIIPYLSPLTKTTQQAILVTAITQANDQLAIAALNFVPKVPYMPTNQGFGYVNLLILGWEAVGCELPLMNAVCEYLQGKVTRVNTSSAT